MALKLPPGWADPDKYGAKEKIDWFNDHDITANDLRDAGIGDATINWMLANGLNKTPSAEDESQVTKDIAQNLYSQANDAYTARINDLVKATGLAKSTVAARVNDGLTDAQIKALVNTTNQQQQQQQQQPPTDYQGVVTGAPGVEFKGSTGLREAYGPYVTDYLSRMSGLLGLRDAENYQPIKFGTAAQGGTYGGDTAKALADLQTQRQNMMGMGASKTPAYQPLDYSFAPKAAAEGGIMSLIEGYQAGGNVSGGSTGNMQGSQVVPSTFDAPDAFSPTTYSSTYTAPTTTYTGPGATGITTGTFDQAALDRFINPYTSSVTDPQVREAKRQAQLASQAQAAKFTQAGAFGGTRNILSENEIGRNLATQIGDITGRGQKEAYDAALRAFEAEQGRKLQAATATEQARQVAGQQALTGAATAGQLGLEASKLGEQSKQFAANLGLQTAQSAAQYDQQARELQQRAEEAQARGDQFAANLALQQLQEAQRAAEAARAFEYQQARDTYLDPFRELGYASQLIQGLPVQAGATGVSPSTEALVAMLGLGNVLKPSDRRLKTDIKPIGMFNDGLKVYSYRYKSGGPVQVGVMADEVAVLRPQAYIKGGAGDGFDAVDYSKL